VQTGSAADWQAGQWWVAKSKLKERHAQGLTGKGVNIALIDGPVSTSIPELVGQDVRPTFSTCGTREEAGPVTPDGPLNDTSFHPTSMAALLVGNGKGTGPGGAGITGVAPGATLRTYAIYNTSDPSKNQNLMCDLAAMPALIDRVVADGADIVEIPVTIQGWSDTFRAAVNRAIAKGVVLVSGAGNDGPATRPDAARRPDRSSRRRGVHLGSHGLPGEPDQLLGQLGVRLGRHQVTLTLRDPSPRPGHQHPRRHCGQREMGVQQAPERDVGSERDRCRAVRPDEAEVAEGHEQPAARLAPAQREPRAGRTGLDAARGVRHELLREHLDH